jgi:hypothetical protein
MQPSDTITSFCKFKLFSTKVEKAENQLASNGNSDLPKTPMPWILPLDVPVPGLPSQTTNWADCAKKESVSNANAKAT